MDRVILHADMNNCYASIEMILNPKLKDKAIAVCGSETERHGIVLAKSQRAKVYGVKTGEAIWEARLKCPELLVVPPHYEAYAKYSKKAKEIYYQYTSQVEAFGLDECWLDVTESKNLYGTGKQIADELRQRMKSELGLTISVGVSYNKIFAKLGSDLKKPDATTLIPKDKIKEIVWPLEVSQLMGVGRATKKKLNWLGIKTLGDLAQGDPKMLKSKLGINGIHLWNYANGREYSPVKDQDIVIPVKSVGRGVTCREDLLNNLEVERIFRSLALDVSKGLREQHLEAGGIQIFIKNDRLQTEQFQRKLPSTTLSSFIITDEAMALFKEKYSWERPVRALTIRAINLLGSANGVQLDMFNSNSSWLKKEGADRVIYKIRNKYGENSISLAGLNQYIKLPKSRPEISVLPEGYWR